MIIVTIYKPPQSWPTERLMTPTDQTTLSASGIGMVESSLVQLEDGDVFHVPMNYAHHARISAGHSALLYTTALAGCTGVAAHSQIEGGSLLGVSHFDPLVDAVQRSNGVCASEKFIQQFTKIAHYLGGQSIKFLVGFEEIHSTDARYTGHDDDAPYDEWHFLRQLECLAEEAEDGVDITLQSYDMTKGPRTLVAGTTLQGDVATELLQ